MTLRASVTADGSAGDPITLLVDGADTPCTANGVPDYAPATGDRVLVEKVGGALEVTRVFSATYTGPSLVGPTILITQSAADFSLASPTALSASVGGAGGSLGTGTYYFVVTAFDANGDQSGPSNEVSATIVTVGQEITLTWDRSTGAATYSVYRGSTSGGENKHVVTVADPGAGTTATYTETGLELLTTASPPSGARIIITPSAVYAYDVMGNETFEIDATTGNATFMGEFGTSDPDAAGVHISSPRFSGLYGLSTYPTIQWNNGSQGVAGNRQPQVFTDTTGNSNLYIWGGAGSTSRMGQVKLDSGRARIGIENTAGTDECDGDRIDINSGLLIIASSAAVQFENNAGTAFQAINAGNITANGTLHSTGTATVGGDCNISGAMQCDGSLQTGASAFQMTTAGGSGWKDLNCGNLNANGSIMATNNLGFQGPTTGSFTANVNWNSTSGNFRVNTSSRRFKENIEDAAIDTRAVLSLRPRSFERNDEEDAEGNPVRTGHRYVGFIAEEAADLGLEEFVVRDAEGKPWSFAYDYWAVAQQAVIREQAQQITDLQQTVADLAARLERLEQSAR